MEEKNKGIKKKIFVKVLIGIIILIILGISGLNLFINRIISEADKNLNMDEFDKAMHYYQIALKYNIGKDQDIKSKIQLCNDLKGSLFAYNAGLDLLNKKDYVEAIRTFGYVNPQDEKRYNLAQAKIAESEELYVESKIESAKYYREHDNYVQAIKILKLILDDDPNNETAKSLITQYEADKDAYLKAKTAKYQAEEDARRKAALEKREAEIKAWQDSIKYR
ncbi:hypothetical protein [Desulfitobacterium metallireducens]|nr:hypothetical protein [Desulfitobacterium metallireducens]